MPAKNLRKYSSSPHLIAGFEIIMNEIADLRGHIAGGATIVGNLLE